MPRKITVGQKELAALRWIAERSGIYDEDREGAAHMKWLGKLLQKAEKSHAPSSNPEGLEALSSFGELESILLTVAGAKAAKMGTLTAREYSIVAAEIKQRRVTAEQMRVVARWIRRQTWMKGKTTLLSVLRSWGNWYGRAEAEKELAEKPRGGPVMLGGDENEE